MTERLQPPAPPVVALCATMSTGVAADLPAEPGAAIGRAVGAGLDSSLRSE
jgi:hypothetical protein